MYVLIAYDRPELVKGGLLSSSYITYRVITKPYNWTVKRRFSDFFWLRNTLAKLYPTTIVYYN